MPVSHSVASRLPLNQLAKMSAAAASSTTAASTAQLQAGDVSSVGQLLPLTDVFVPLETIQPGTIFCESVEIESIEQLTEQHNPRPAASQQCFIVFMLLLIFCSILTR